MFLLKETYLVTFVLTCVLGVSVVLRGIKRRAIFLWFLVSVSLSLWSLGFALGVSATSEKDALFWLIT